MALQIQHTEEPCGMICSFDFKIEKTINKTMSSRLSEHFRVEKLVALYILQCRFLLRAAQIFPYKNRAHLGKNLCKRQK